MTDITSIKEAFSKVPAISCVEYYFLAYRQINNFENRFLYAESYVSFAKLLKDFEEGYEYENYIGIKRLQEISEEYGLSKHCILTTLPDAIENGLFLMRVNENYLSKITNRPWREDHYVMVLKEEKYLLLDYYPFQIIETDNLKEFFGGCYLHYEFLHENDYKLKEKSLRQAQSFLMSESDYLINCYLNPKILMNALGIYKKVVRRIQDNLEVLAELKYIGKFGNTENVFNELKNYIDKAFAVASYSVVRGKVLNSLDDCGRHINNLVEEIKNAYRI